MNWGADDVLATPLARLNHNGEPYCLGPWWYDVDRPTDLQFLASHLKNRLRSFGGQAIALGSPHPCPATAAVVKRIEKEFPELDSANVL